MPGGNFTQGISKIRPGTYVNFEATQANEGAANERGIVLIPLPLNWGPVNEFITIDNSVPNGQFEKLGYSIYDDTNVNMLLIREAFKLARQVILYGLAGGTKATATANGLTTTAKWEGTRGNDLKVVIEANPLTGFDVTIYLDTTIVFEQISAATIGDLEVNDWIVWSGTAGDALVANAGIILATGTDTAVVNLDITTFLDNSEVVVWNSMCFPYTDGTLQAALLSKIQYFRDNIGKKVSAIAPSFEANYEGIIGVDNGVLLTDGTQITATQACAWMAAADASSVNTQSNTFLVYEGADDVLGKKTDEQAKDATNKGLIFFIANRGNVVLEYDINTLTDFSTPKSKDYRKNRVRRVLDTFNDSLQEIFPPNKYDNVDEGWDLMESAGKQLLQQYTNDGAITNVNLDTDFLVDRNLSVDDETFINVGIQPVDSSEKLYFTVRTR